MFIEGDTIYSYGKHFPIALRLGNNIFLVNVDKYSSSTSKHQSYVIGAISDKGSIIECNTQDIVRAIDRNPFCIEKKFEHKSIGKCFENIKDILNEKGIKRVPIKKWKQMIDDFEMIKSIWGETKWRKCVEL